MKKKMKPKHPLEPRFYWDEDVGWYKLVVLDMQITIGFDDDGKINDVAAINPSGILISYPKETKRHKEKTE